MKISSINLESSSYTKNNCGVPQGFMLDPVLFSMQMMLSLMHQ